MTAPYHVHMKVVDSLPTSLIAVDHEPVTVLRDPLLFCDLCCHKDHVTDDMLIGLIDVIHRRDVIPWDHKDMCGGRVSKMMTDYKLLSHSKLRHTLV